MAVDMNGHEPPFDNELVGKAKKLAPKLEERSPRTESDRRLPEETVSDLVEIGIASAFVPKVHGGAETDFHTWFDTVLELGRGCASTAWCASLWLHYGLIAGMFPAAAQKEIWRSGPDTRFATALFQRDGTVEPTSDGYRVSGVFPTASGAHHADWAMVGCVIPPTGGGKPEIRLALIPPGEFAVRDDWHTAGMRGTGSCSLLVDGVDVPTEHTIAMSDKVRGTTDGGAHHGGRYRSPWSLYAGLTFVTPLLGAARGAVEHFAQWAAAKRGPTGDVLAERPAVQVGVADIDAKLDSAELLMRRVAADADGYDAERPDELVLRRVSRDACYSAKIVREAADDLLRLGGSAALAEHSPIQRAWRDINAGASHIALDFNGAGAGYGRGLLGLPMTSGNPFA